MYNAYQRYLEEQRVKEFEAKILREYIAENYRPLLTPYEESLLKGYFKENGKTL